MTANAHFNIPAGTSAEVHIIDTGVRMFDLKLGVLLAPGIDHFDKFPPLASWSFLIQSSKGQKVLFDLSFPPDARAYPPAASELLNGVGVKVEGVKHVANILKENGIDPAEISSVIWSHHHWDHIGDITTFPQTTEIVVGPGFKEAFLPGYPTKPDTWLEERHFEGRNLREIDFSWQNLTVGNFQAFDFFGDGSFYLLNSPGHDTGHLAGFARTTTNPDTFIFMGGDICHHGGELRPSPYLPIPIDKRVSLPGPLRLQISTCPGALQFRELNIKRGREPNAPFFDPVVAVDMAQAVQMVKDSQVADAKGNIFYIFAHDMTIEGTVDFFPHSANEWKKKEWKEKTLWNFLEDLALAAAQTTV